METVQLKEKADAQAAELSKKIMPLKEEGKAENGWLPDEAFAVEKGSIDWRKVLDDALWKSLQEAAKEKTVADMAFSVFWSGALFLPKALETALKEIRRLSKEQNEKTKEAKKNAIDNSLRAKGMTRTALMTQIALRAQDWLFSTKHVVFDEHGRVKTHGLTRLQKAHTNKYLFARKLPLNADGSLDFKRFSKYQGMRFTKYLLAYAQYDPDFKRYVRSMAEAVLSKEELLKLGRFAASMSLRSNAPHHVVVSSRNVSRRGKFQPFVDTGNVRSA